MRGLFSASVSTQAPQGRIDPCLTAVCMVSFLGQQHMEFFMFIQIITHTPIWVWAIFVLLLWLGFKQSLPSTPGLTRITLIPLAMLGLSLYGLVSVFRSTGTLLMAWVCPAALAALAAFITVHQPFNIQNTISGRSALSCLVVGYRWC